MRLYVTRIDPIEILEKCTIRDDTFEPNQWTIIEVERIQKVVKFLIDNITAPRVITISKARIGDDQIKGGVYPE